MMPLHSPLNTKRIEYIDWLRAIAAGLVLLGHSANQIAPGGAIGVSIFFVLSGYLITSILLRDGMMTSANIAKFIIRRVARIYPMYFVQIALAVVVLALFQRDRVGPALSAVPGLLTFTSDAPEWLGYGFGVLWTLSVEFWFYVTFPVLLWVALLTGRVIQFILAGIAISLAAKVFGLRVPTLQYYDHFLIGSLCYAAVKFKAIPEFIRWPKLFLAGIIAILIIAAMPYPGTRGLLWFCQSLGAATATALVILAGHVHAPTRTIPLLAFLGRISYSVYLIHAVVLDVFVLKGKIESYLWLFIVAVVAISTITYYAIERPVERKAKRSIGYIFAQ